MKTRGLPSLVSLKDRFPEKHDVKDLPCGNCKRGLYVVPVHKPSMDLAKMSEGEAARDIRPCVHDSSKPCQGEMDILQFCILKKL